MVKQVRRGEIYFADLNPYIGSEQGGKRPVIVVQNDRGNAYSPTTIVVPVSTTPTKGKLPTHVELHNHILLQGSVALTEQLRVADKSRLLNHLGILTAHEMEKIDKALIASVGLEEHYDEL